MRPPRPPLHVLIAPLDWGLGHTSRCVPIIRHLLAQGSRVTAAGTDWQQSFYAQTFPQEMASGTLRLRELPGYNVRYAKTGAGFRSRILLQIPRILRTIRAERRWLQDAQKHEQFDGIISDNRYGLLHPRVPSVVLTHQVSPLSGLGRMADAALRRIHLHALQRFDECWVVDVAGAPGLSGSLAHPAQLPRTTRYIGLLSQFSAGNEVASYTHADNGPVVVLLSGPEPQRTLLAERLWLQVRHHQGPVVFVEGTETAAIPDDIPAHIIHHRRLTAPVLKPLLETASTIICRSGYSTLMDLAALGKRAVIIPTPGQTEQEYLAETLSTRGLFVVARQENFSLKSALTQLDALPEKRAEFSGEHFGIYRRVVDEWLDTL